MVQLDIQAVLNSVWGQDYSPWDGCKSRLRSHHEPGRLSGKFSCSTSMRKGGVGVVGTGGTGLTNAHRDLSMFLALQIELWAERACLHPSLQARHFGKTDEIQVILCSALLKYSPVEKVLLVFQNLPTQTWFRQQHQHLLGAYQKSRIPSLTLDLPGIICGSQGTHVLIKICKVVVGKPSFQSGVFGDSTGHWGLSLPATDVLRDMKVTPESAEIRQREAKRILKSSWK